MNAPKADIIVIGAGPAGVLAALRAAELGARTTLLSRDGFGGMAANDGPVPVRTLAHAARLIRDARRLGRYGVAVGDPVLDYPRLLARVREVADEVRSRSSLRGRIDSLGVTLLENAGAARFIDAHTVETGSGLRLQADQFVLCTGGVSRRLPIPGFELTGTHHDAWALTSVPPSLLVVGGGATGVQVASIFRSFGSRVQLFEAAPRILLTEDDDTAAAVKAAFLESGIDVRENFGAIESFERTPVGVKMNYIHCSERGSVEASLAVVAVGWAADTTGLNLAAAGVETDRRGFVRVDDCLRTSAPHIFAAGDVTGRLMLVPEALQDGYVAAGNAAQSATTKRVVRVNPAGSFTDPEYGSVGLSERKARETNDIVVTVVRFDSTTRAMIDGQTFGFCKLIVDRKTHGILGCHVVGERAVEIVQVAAIAMSAGMRVDELAQVPVSFPTYAGILTLAAAKASRELEVTPGGPETHPDFAAQASAGGVIDVSKHS